MATETIPVPAPDSDRWHAKARELLFKRDKLEKFAKTIPNVKHYQALLADVPNLDIRQQLDAALRPLLSFDPPPAIVVVQPSVNNKGESTDGSIEAPGTPEHVEVAHVRAEDQHVPDLEAGRRVELRKGRRQKAVKKPPTKKKPTKKKTRRR